MTGRRAGSELDGLGGQLGTVMAYEAARCLAWEHRTCRDRLSPRALAILDAGAGTDPAAYDRVRDRVRRARARLDDLLFGDADVVMTLAAVGEAPAGLDSTGDPRCCTLWSLLGLPALSVPGLTGIRPAFPSVCSWSAGPVTTPGCSPPAPGWRPGCPARRRPPSPAAVAACRWRRRRGRRRRASLAGSSG